MIAVGGGAEVEARLAWCEGGADGNGWKLASASMNSKWLAFEMETQIAIREIQIPSLRLRPPRLHKCENWRYTTAETIESRLTAKARIAILACALASGDGIHPKMANKDEGGDGSVCMGGEHGMDDKKLTEISAKMNPDNEIITKVAGSSTLIPMSCIHLILPNVNGREGAPRE